MASRLPTNTRLLTTIAGRCDAYAMSPTSIRISRKYFILVGLVIILLLASAYALYSWHGSSKQSSGNKAGQWLQGSTTATAGIQHDTHATSGYALNYPAQWARTTPDNSPYTILTSTQNGVQYTFRISPPGQINPEGKDNVTATTDKVTYANRTYVRTVWRTNDQAFYVTAVPQDLETGTSTTNANEYDMMMDFPPGASGDYLSVFDQVAKTLKY
jgi:hypothetical protein